MPGLKGMRIADGYIRPAVIAFEQDSRTGQSACVRFPSPHKHLHMASFVTASVDGSGSDHEASPGFPLAYHNFKLD